MDWAGRVGAVGGSSCCGETVGRDERCGSLREQVLGLSSSSHVEHPAPGKIVLPLWDETSGAGDRFPVRRGSGELLYWLW